ncbi:MAG: M23 family metallopeptidase [Oscillospiraceae bacterium]|nr:M23 family metallopeptidase [Oscillospiraceae bacterium]
MMQNNHKPNGFRRFLRDHGYLLVIGACALAIGVSGWLMFRGGSEPEAEETMSIPVTIEPDDRPAEAPIIPAEDAIAEEEETEPVMAETPEVTEPADAPAPEAPVAAPRIVVMPVSGDTIASHSLSALSYNVTTQDWRTHDGIDLAAEQGAAVAATEAGTVSAVYRDDYLGTTVEISHASGYTTCYSNLQETPAVTVGQTVAAGEVIGVVGSSALLEVGHPSHLHFAVTFGNASVDPADYLA